MMAQKEKQDKDFEEVTTVDFDKGDLEMFQKITAEKNKDPVKLVQNK